MKILREASRGGWVVLLALLLCALSAGQVIAEPEAGDSQQLQAPPESTPGFELKEKRTATSETFRLPGGALEARIYESPIHYRDADGEWKSIGEQLEEASDGGLTNGANSFDLELPERLGEAPVRIGVGEEWVSYELVGPSSDPAELDGETAVYEADDPGTQFEFTSLPSGLKEDIVLADASQPSTFVFQLGASKGLTPVLTEVGAVELRDETGELVVTLPAPVMVDSAPEHPAASRDVDYELSPDGDGAWLLTVEPDRGWLESEDRVWPVRIDPTVVVPSPATDCNYGKQGSSAWGECFPSNGPPRLRAGYLPPVAKSEKEGGGFFPEQWLRAALRFDLAAIPANAYVSQATLGLYAPSSALNTGGVNILQAGKPWDKNLTWLRYNASSNWTKEGGDFGPGSSTVLTANRGSQAGPWEFTSGMTEIVGDWVSGAAPNQGLLAKLVEDAYPACEPSPCSKRLVEFDASASSEAGHRPYLSVTYYTPSNGASVSRPTAGSQTSRYMPLQADWNGTSVSAVTFQAKLEGWGHFKTIPANLVRERDGQAVSWPYAVKGSEMEPLYFDAAAYESLVDSEPEAKVQIRALAESTNPSINGYTVPVDAVLDRYVGGPRDAVAAVGPGSVNLTTGNYTISRTDVAISGFGSTLEFARSRSSRDPHDPKTTNDLNSTLSTNVLGQGWKPSVPVEAAGGALWQKAWDANAAEEEPYVLLTDLEGYEYAFEEVSGSYVTPPEMTGWLLTRQDATHLALADPDGNVTVFEKEASGHDYLPTSISQTGGAGNKTRMVYQTAGGKKRLSMIIAPTPSGVSCNTEAEALSNLGCRSLLFSYLPATTWGASGSNGDRLATITYRGPANASTMSSWEVSKYSYDSNGQLVAQWDPRISPALKEAYAYEGIFLKAITPPGEEPMSFEYYPAGIDEIGGRLKSVSRTTLLASPSVAQTTVVYGLPLSGSGAPYDMSPATVGKWDQQDVPMGATAIFPPDQVPSIPPSSYSRATVYYTDSEGQQVNVATPSGAGTSAPSITTAETDEHGNVVRALGAQNRLRALAAGEGSIGKSRELDTTRTFSTDGTELLQEWGPVHEVRLESGATVQASMHRTVTYDQGAPAPPAGTPKYHLPTSETVGALVVGQEADVDQRVTETKYDWTLRKPTETIVDPAGLKLHTRVAYDATSGLVTERSLPAKPEGGDARTTKFLYYTAGAHPTDSFCSNKPAWANLPCKKLPAAQPGTAGQPDLLVTKYISYNALGQATEVSENAGGGNADPRTTVSTYDAAGRTLTVKRVGGGVAIPTTETLYSSSTGRPTTQRFVCESGCKTSIDYSSSFGSLGTSDGQFNRPAGSAVDAQGNLWVIDKSNNRVQKFDASGKFLAKFGSSGTAGGQLSGPSDIAIDAKGNLWVADSGNRRVQKFDSSGKYLTKFGSQGSGNGQFSGNGPRGIAIDDQGDLWVSDYSGRVQEFDASGGFVKAVGTSGSGEGQFGESAGLDVGDGKVWVGDWTKNRVSVFSEAGKFLFQFGFSGAGNGQFNHPDAVEVDSQGNVWVVDEGNSRIQQFDLEGKYVAQFGSKGTGSGQFGLGWPLGIASDSSGSVWVSDTTNHRVQKWVASSSFDAQATRTTYDTLGRPIAYQDADGNTSNTGYDFMGRPVITSDGKGVQTRTYDATTGLLVQLNDSAAGTFTASYDADGSLVEQGLPNGLVAETTYDETGVSVHLSYEKTINCVTNCTWLDFDVEESIHGQWLSQTSTLSSQQYSYDKAGRLTLVKDTPKGGSCTTRAYSYDANSNRTEMITRAPGIGGACDTTSKGTVQSYSYDTGDRLLGSEIAYDDFGRITTLPKAFSGGGTLTSTYYSNDLVRSQTQDGLTNTYELDATLRQRQRVQTGSKTGTETYHYAGASDSPVWIDSGSSWSRNIGGIGGELAAIQDSATGTTLQLTNLHGDIVATASLSTEATKPLATFESDEFGNPKGTGAGKYGWLGGKQRRTELSSGVIQMGVRSYVPAMGRFTSVDPVVGGSANSYEYGGGDPVNNFDLNGEWFYAKDCWEGAAGCQCKIELWLESYRRGRMKIRIRRQCNRFGGVSVSKKGYTVGYQVGSGGGDFKDIPAPQFVNPKVSVKPICRETDPCQNSVDSKGTFICTPGREYQVTVAWAPSANYGPGSGQEKWLQVQAQQFCRKDR